MLPMNSTNSFDTFCRDLSRQVIDMGALKAAVVPVSDVRFEAVFRDMCKSNACGKYGRCWTCPPDIGTIDQLMEDAKSYSHILVYQTVGILEDSFDFEGMMEAGNKHNQLAQDVLKWSKSLPLARSLALGAGGCRVCSVCARETNEPCRHPDLAMSSLEAYGIAVSELAKTCGMKYINGPDTVTYFGCLFFDPE